MNKTTGTQLFISNDKLPENPTKEDYEKLSWIEIGEITKPIIDVAIKTGKFITHGSVLPYAPLEENLIKIRGRFDLAIGKIKKTKRQQFGRSIKFRG